MHFSPPGNRAILSTFWGDFLAKLHRKPGKNLFKKNPLEEFKQNQVEMAVENCRFLSLVMIERALTTTPPKNALWLSVAQVCRKLRAKLAQKITCMSFRTSEGGCAKSSQICRKLEIQGVFIEKGPFLRSKGASRAPPPAPPFLGPPLWGRAGPQRGPRAGGERARPLYHKKKAPFRWKRLINFRFWRISRYREVSQRWYPR